MKNLEKFCLTQVLGIGFDTPYEKVLQKQPYLTFVCDPPIGCL